MRTQLLFCLSLGLALISCKDSEVPPSEPNVSLYCSNPMLVEGGETIEVTVELDREYKDHRIVYLDYGSTYGEYPFFFTDELRQTEATLKVEGKDLPVLKVLFSAGERKKTLRLTAAENNWYRGSREVELRALTLEKDVPVLKSSLNIEYTENEPKPVFGILRNWEADTLTVTNKRGGGNFALTLVSSVPFQFTQKLYLSYTGTAVEGTHFQKFGYVEFKRNTGDRYPVIHPSVLTVLASGNFSPEKSIRIKIAAAEDGEVARYKENSNISGDFYKLVLTEN